MDQDLSAGPAAGVAWASAQGGITVLPDAANPQRAARGWPALYHGLPAMPRLARAVGGRPASAPALTLALVLQRRPAPDEDSVFELVESATLACDVTLALPDGVPDSVRPLYARAAELALVRVADGAVLAAVAGSGAGWRAGLSARLDRSAAQGVLAALDGQQAGLALHCTIDYRAAGTREQLRLALHWTAIRDAIGAELAAGLIADNGLEGGKDGADDSDARTLDGAALRGLLPELVASGCLRAWRVEPDGSETALAPERADDLWPAFAMLSGTLLERLTPQLAPTDAAARFALRPGPAPSGEYVTQWTLGSARAQRVDLQAPLEAVLGGTLAGQRTEEFIHLVCPDPTAPGAYVPAPPRVRVTPTRAGPGDAMPPAGMALVGGRLVSMTRALEPDRSRAAPLGAVLATDAVRFDTQHAFALHAIELEDNGKPSLPRVDRNSNVYWPDYRDGVRRLWYPSEFALVQPDPAAAPDASPFLFSFRQVGHDAAGQPALEGLVRCTLRRGASAATLAAIAERGNPLSAPVPPLGLAVSLSLPVRDAGGQLRRIDLAATVVDQGDTLVAEIALLGEYVRAAYGALALPGFQSEPVRLQVAYSFDAMVDDRDTKLTLAYAGKIARTPVAYTAAQGTELAGRAHMDAVGLAFRAPLGDLQFRREAAAPRAAGASEPVPEPIPEPIPEPALTANGNGNGGTATVAAARVARPGVASVAGAALPAHVSQVHAAPAVAIQPQVENVALQQELLQRSEFRRRTLGRSVTLDAFFPCNTLGAFYCQQQDDTLAAIGCRAAFSLGQVPFKLYEPVSDPGLTGLPCQVLRSLSQPGRFVLLPATYLITRFGPGEGERAYRPAIYLYSTVDADVPANNRCVLMATLQPDLTPDQRHRIDAVLATLHKTPVLDEITAIDCAVKQSDWLAGLAPEVARLWDGFQVTLSTDPAGALMLQEMLKHGGAAATVTFTLADGATLSSALQLDLNRLTGPWDGGPVQVAADGASAVLTNRIERPVDVSDLAVLDAGGAVAHVAVERQLAPGQASSVALPAATHPGWAVFSIPPGDAATLDEIRSFVEDIQTNVLFINIINYANHGLRRLDLRARLKEVAGSEKAVTMNDEQTMGEAVFMLPLTVYQGPRTLQFQVTKTDTAGAVAATGWLEADLRTGNAVTLTWDLIA